MLDAYNAPASIQADQAAKQLDVLIEKKSTNVKKMKGYKSWWWRRQARWQRWCRGESASNPSSAEVANAKSLRTTGYRKRLLDVVFIRRCHIRMRRSSAWGNGKEKAISRA